MGLTYYHVIYGLYTYMLPTVNKTVANESFGPQHEETPSVIVKVINGVKSEGTL